LFSSQPRRPHSISAAQSFARAVRTPSGRIDHRRRWNKGCCGCQIGDVGRWARDGPQGKPSADSSNLFHGAPPEDRCPSSITGLPGAAPRAVRTLAPWGSRDMVSNHRSSRGHPGGGGTTRIQDEKASMARPKQAPRSKCLNPLDSPAGTRLEDTVVRSMVVGTPVQSPWGVPRGAHLLAAGKKMNFRTCKILCSKQK